MAPDATDIDSFRDELRRVLESVTFEKAPKLRELLYWLVERAITEPARPLNQYEIATEALRYRSSYDVASGGVRKAIVRLRQALERYYAGRGRLNRFRIIIDKEHYMPRLRRREETSLPDALPAQTTAGLVVLVLPFLPIGFRDRRCFCDALTLCLMQAVAASGQARVVPWTTAKWLTTKTGNKREFHPIVGADVILEGLVQECPGDRYRVSVHWIDGLTGVFDTFHQVIGELSDSLSLVSELAPKICPGLSVTFDERTRAQLAMRRSANATAAAYYLRAREAAINLTAPAIGAALKLVRQSLRHDPYFAAAHALAAEVHLCIGDAGIAPATEHAPIARDEAAQALSLAPELGDAMGAMGAVEFAYDWDLPRAGKTLERASSDPLAEHVPHWPPLLDVAHGRVEEAAIKFEKWARMDVGSTGKASIACELWYTARQYRSAIRWGLRALELDPYNVRAGIFLANSYLNAGQTEEGLRVAESMCDITPDLAFTTLTTTAFLAKCGRSADAWRTLKAWEARRAPGYVFPILKAMVYAWLGETSHALEALRDTVRARHTVCLFARSAPFLDPLRGLPEFDRILTEAGLPSGSDTES